MGEGVRRARRLAVEVDPARAFQRITEEIRMQDLSQDAG
jgi:hypothetical protein